MTANEIKKAKKIRLALLLIGLFFGVMAVVATVYPKTDPIGIRCLSAFSCLLAAVVWTLPGTLKVSTAKCITALVIANFLIPFSILGHRALLVKTQWNDVYFKFGELSESKSFDFVALSRFLSSTLERGQLFFLGVSGIAALTLLALAYLAQTEKEKKTESAL